MFTQLRVLDGCGCLVVYYSSCLNLLLVKTEVSVRGLITVFPLFSHNEEGDEGESLSTHGGTMMIWMKQMKRKTREAQATYAPNLESTCLEYCRDERGGRDRDSDSICDNTAPSPELSSVTSINQHTTLLLKSRDQHMGWSQKFNTGDFLKDKVAEDKQTRLMRIFVISVLWPLTESLNYSINAAQTDRWYQYRLLGPASYSWNKVRLSFCRGKIACHG